MKIIILRLAVKLVLFFFQKMTIDQENYKVSSEILKERARVLKGKS